MSPVQFPAYGKPDFWKEAERRGLTVMKCIKIMGKGPTVAKRVKTPTLRDNSDKDICRALPYGHPDFAKEAERRELTEKKCKETLGQ